MTTVYVVYLLVIDVIIITFLAAIREPHSHSWCLTYYGGMRNNPGGEKRRCRQYTNQPGIRVVMWGGGGEVVPPAFPHPVLSPAHVQIFKFLMTTYPFPLFLGYPSCLVIRSLIEMNSYVMTTFGTVYSLVMMVITTSIERLLL